MSLLNYANFNPHDVSMHNYPKHEPTVSEFHPPIPNAPVFRDKKLLNPRGHYRSFTRIMRSTAGGR